MMFKTIRFVDSFDDRILGKCLRNRLREQIFKKGSPYHQKLSIYRVSITNVSFFTW